MRDSLSPHFRWSQTWEYPNWLLICILIVLVITHGHMTRRSSNSGGSSQANKSKSHLGLFTQGPVFHARLFQHLTHEHREGGTHNVQITWILNISSSGYENLFLQVGYFLLLHHISRSAPHFFFFFTAFLSAASRIFRRQDSFCVNGPLKG